MRAHTQWRIGDDATIFSVPEAYRKMWIKWNRSNLLPSVRLLGSGSLQRRRDWRDGSGGDGGSKKKRLISMNSDTYAVYGIQMNRVKNVCSVHTVHRPCLDSSIIINHIFVQRFTISLTRSHSHTCAVNVQPNCPMKVFGLNRRKKNLNFEFNIFSHRLIVGSLHWDDETSTEKHIIHSGSPSIVYRFSVLCWSQADSANVWSVIFLASLQIGKWLFRCYILFIWTELTWVKHFEIRENLKIWHACED